MGDQSGMSAESCVLDLLAMAHPRRFRFAVELHEPFADRTWTDTVREVEDLGYSTMFVPDHFDEGLGPLAAMASAVAVTSTHERRQPRVRLRLPSSGGTGARAGHDRRAVRRTTRGRPGGGVEEPRLPTGGHRHGSARSPRRSHDRAHHRAQGIVRARPVHVRGRALPDRRSGWHTRTYVDRVVRPSSSVAAPSACCVSPARPPTSSG